jgi:3-hydroxyisobutyrate dehydrogenase
MKAHEFTKPKIGIIGLGIMGTALAKRLQEKGYQLFLYNRTSERAIQVARKHDNVCRSPAHLAKHADIIISFVSDDMASENVWFGTDGAASSAKKSSICIESSTLSPDYIES